MKSGFAALAAMLAVSVSWSAALACEFHNHASTATLAAATVPPPAPRPVVVRPRAVAEDELVLPQSKPELTTATTGGIGMGCNRMREKAQTVYLTQ